MITYQYNQPLDPADIARVFDASGITRPTNDLPRIARMFEHANLVISAWNQDQLVGVCRALTDFSFCCNLSDLSVDRAYQKQGIGSTLIQHVRNAIDDRVSLILLSAPGAMSYYPSVGFSAIENGFVIKRQR